MVAICLFEICLLALWEGAYHSAERSFHEPFHNSPCTRYLKSTIAVVISTALDEDPRRHGRVQNGLKALVFGGFDIGPVSNSSRKTHNSAFLKEALQLPKAEHNNPALMLSQHILHNKSGLNLHFHYLASNILSFQLLTLLRLAQVKIVVIITLVVTITSITLYGYSSTSPSVTKLVFSHLSFIQLRYYSKLL